MFCDQRIRNDPYQQQELLHFLAHYDAGGSASISSTPSASTVPISTTDDDLLSTKADSCTEFLRYLMTAVDNEEEEDALVSRYIQSAPRRLQFSQDSSVLELVRLVSAEPQNQQYIHDEALIRMGQVMEQKWWGHLKLESEPTH